MERWGLTVTKSGSHHVYVNSRESQNIREREYSPPRHSRPRHSYQNNPNQILQKSRNSPKIRGRPSTCCAPKAKISEEDPRATGGLVTKVFNLPHPRVNKTKQQTLNKETPPGGGVSFDQLVLPFAPCGNREQEQGTHSLWYCLVAARGWSFLRCRSASGSVFPGISGQILQGFIVLKSVISDGQALKIWQIYVLGQIFDKCMNKDCFYHCYSQGAVDHSHWSEWPKFADCHGRHMFYLSQKKRHVKSKGS